MSAQTAATRKHKYSADPVTPVIIKSGGGNNEYVLGGTSLVEIDSPLMPFAEAENGPTWETSRSTLAGRITQVTIKDGTEFIHTSIAPGEELVTIRIMYAVDQLTVAETREKEHQVFLLVTSAEVPFNDPSENDWTKSNATFPNPISSVTVMVGDKVDLSHQCQTPDVAVHFNFNLI